MNLGCSGLSSALECTIFWATVSICVLIDRVLMEVKPALGHREGPSQQLHLYTCLGSGLWPVPCPRLCAGHLGPLRPTCSSRGSGDLFLLS